MRDDALELLREIVAHADDQWVDDDGLYFCHWCGEVQGKDVDIGPPGEDTIVTPEGEWHDKNCLLLKARRFVR